MNNDAKYALERLETMTEEEMRAKPLLYSAFINSLISELTAFKHMGDMLSAKGNYRPSLNVSCLEYGLAFGHIADAYDRLMAYQNDDRRAFRF